MPHRFTVLLIVAMLFLGASVIALFTLMGIRAGQNKPIDADVVIKGSTTHVQLSRTVTAFDPRDPLALSPLLVGAGLVVPNFELIDQDHRSQTQEVFDDEVTVISFVFTHCTLACPIVTGRMFGVYQKAEGLDTRFLSITVDPTRDTPEVLTKYAKNFGIDHARWKFLTGDYAAIENIATVGLKFAITEDPSEENLITLEDGSTMSNIQHPTKLIVIGPKREIIGIYDPYQKADLDLLVARLKAIDRVRPKG